MPDQLIESDERCGDLELELESRGTQHYSARLRFTPPPALGSPTDRLLEQRLGEAADVFGVAGPFDIRIDSAFLQQFTDPREHGERLCRALLSVGPIRAYLRLVREVCAAQEAALSLRLLLGPGASELHALRWEALADPPEETAPLLSGRRYFSRFLSSRDCSPVRLKARRDLSALVVVANPPWLPEAGLAPIPVAAHIELASRVLGPFVSDLGLLGDPEGSAFSGRVVPGEADLAGLSAQLEAGFDMVYLLAHGALTDDGPMLYLPQARRLPTPASALREVVERVGPRRPRLVLLASCQSAGGPTSAHPLTALGPLLAEAGVPAVVGMQGNLPIPAAESFFTCFFKELSAHGLVHRATAMARESLRLGGQAGWEMPVLFMRLRSGRIWYVPRMGGRGTEFSKWDAIIDQIKQRRCTPILGPSLLEPYLGGNTQIARTWARKHHFPLWPYQQDDLAMVTQYLAMQQNQRFPKDQLAQYAREHVQKNLMQGSPQPAPAPASPAAASNDLWGEEPAAGASGQSLDEMLVEAWHRHTGKDDPYAILARMPLPIFLTVNQDLLMEAALKEMGKRPHVAVSPWAPEVFDSEDSDGMGLALPYPRIDAETDYMPSKDEPLVYHLFGLFRHPGSMVVTEDDHFRFLMWTVESREESKGKRRHPARVKAQLASSALLYLGFQIDSWQFRLLRHALMSQAGRRPGKVTNLAAQVDPNEEQFIDPKAAIRYLETYFKEGDLDMYWGSVGDFLGELTRRVAGSGPGAAHG